MRDVVTSLFLATALIAGPVNAKDLPDAEFVLSGRILPGIQEGRIVPVFVHLKTQSDSLDWTFVTSYFPESFSCETFQKCDWAVNGLTHYVDWSEDGQFTIRETTRRQGDGMNIDRAEFDGPEILDPIDGLVRSGSLQLAESRGVFALTGRRSKGVVAELIPATLDDLLDAISFVRVLELSMGQLDQCGVYPVLQLMAQSTRTTQEQEVVDAARFLGRHARLDAEASYYAFQESPSDSEQERQAMATLVAMMQFARVMPTQQMVEAMMRGDRLSDLEVLDISREAVEPHLEELGTNADAFMEDLFVTNRHEFLAVARVTARFLAHIHDGRDPYELTCADVTFSR